jgi:methylenetetrahydrofolate reductase (NADPH)
LPIIPGILPVTNVKQLVRMSELSGTPIPANILARFSKIEADQEAVQKLGIEIATELCEQLLELGVPGLHFYTLNTSPATLEIYRKLVTK